MRRLADLGKHEPFKVIRYRRSIMSRARNLERAAGDAHIYRRVMASMSKVRLHEHHAVL